ncbi:MAG TPA: LysM domain-containing protein [Ramlibacter sp.]|uniref:LysM peptidoglycan-binding domain-containing protein n=1 Tax=Ramlibacter sp. TaxID=1917967 RepID=UPI002ED1EAEC
MARSKTAFLLSPRTLAAAAALVAGSGLALTVLAQNFPVTPQQRSTAEQVAAAGVPLSELAPNAPDTYTVKSGDTLWGISGMFLKSPWRWPELWGMNMDQVRNPHRIYPGQILYLEKVDGLARLRIGQPPAGTALDTVRVSPRTRLAGLVDTSIPTLPPHLIEPFLNEAILVNDAETLENAPRIVAVPEDRVLITQGDRAYARGMTGTPLVERDPRVSDNFRVFRNATPLRDPGTRQVLGFEAKYLGSAELVRGEGVKDVSSATQAATMLVPATIDITRAKEEIRVGDRLLPEPARMLGSYVPHAPVHAVDGTIVSVYGDAVAMAGQSQVVVINKGLADGVETGHVLAIQKAGRRIVDRSKDGERAHLQLPDERNGLMMVFRSFDRLSYALVLDVTDVVRVGDRVVNPR